MPITSMTERQKYLTLLGLVIEDLPGNAVDATLRAGYSASSDLLNEARTSRLMNLEYLVALVDFGLPHYQIPPELLPAEPRQHLDFLSNA